MTVVEGAGSPAVARPGDLVDVVRRLAGARHVEDIVEIVRHAARELTGADGATFVLRRGDSCHYVDEDAIAPLWKGRMFPMETCISGWAMLHRTAAVIADVFEDARIPHDAYRPTFVRSLVMTPIRTEEPVGAIGVYWACTRVATPDEVALLQALADSTAVAMENVRVYAELEARVAARTAELETANAELHQLTTAVAHDIRSPLASVRGFADLLVTQYQDQMTPDVRDAAERVNRAAERLSTFVTDLLDYLTAGTGPLRVEPVELDALVADVRDRLAADIAARHATVQTDGAEVLVGDRALLERVVQNLVANAVAYTPCDREPVVTISLYEVAGDSVLTVADNGDGIPPDERERVFEPFQRGVAGAARTGSGLGLAFCRKVAEQHGGDLTLTTAPGGGAAFVLRIPRVSP